MNISTLKRGDRFLLDPQDAIEYVYLHEGCDGRHVASLAHRRTEVVMFAADTQVVR